MTDTTSPCTLPHSMPENMSGMKLYSTCDLLKGGACNACKDYIALEAKISAREQALDELVSQRPKMRTRVNQNHDLFTRSVPLEIVCSVFQFCVPEKSSFDRFNEPYYQWKSRDKQMVSAPLLLGSVCRTWRDIAWGMKSLWTLFTLNVDFYFKNSDKVALTREWLDRAGQLPLSIHITSHFYGPSKHQVEIAAQVLALVNERSEQWESLDLVRCEGWTLQALARSGGAPNLQTLKLMDISDRDEFALIGLKPSRLVLHNCDLGPISIEWNNLTHLFVSESSLDEGIELLRRAPKLVYCKLYSVYKRSHNFPIHIEPITRPSLEFLEFDCEGDEKSQTREIITFCKSFIFPNLKHLKLQNGGFLYDRPNDHNLSWDPMVAQIVDASPRLVLLAFSLHIGLHPIRQCIIPILRRTPSLRDLEMYAPFHEEWEGGQNEFFNLLANTSILANDHTDTSFLPNLQSIKFHLCAEDEEPGSRFWESVSGIFGPISEIHNPRRRPLTTLRVRSTEDTLDLSKDALLQLLRLQQEGIVLDLQDVDEELDLLEDFIEWHGLG